MFSDLAPIGWIRSLAERRQSAALVVVFVLAVVKMSPPISGCAEQSRAAEAPQQADVKNRATLPAVVQRVLAWFPSDTETIVVANSLKLVPSNIIPDDTAGLGPIDFNAVQFRLAVGELAVLKKGKYLIPFAGRKLALALSGGRNFEFVSAFGSHRSEGCGVLLFEEKLGDLPIKEWLAMLRDDAAAVKRIAGREVFVFPSTVVMESVFEPHPWQGTYVTMLSPEVVLCATSDKFLEQLLIRADVLSVNRALPDTLPIWSQVDFAAPTWLLRHVPKINDKRTVESVGYSMEMDRVRVVYNPLPNQRDKLERVVRARWQPKKVALRSELEKPPDGSIVVYSQTQNLDAATAFFLYLNLYWLEGEFGETSPD
jgi:hypothetical protein